MLFYFGSEFSITGTGTYRTHQLRSLDLEKRREILFLLLLTLMAGKSETNSPPPPHPMCHDLSILHVHTSSLSQLTFRHFHEFQTYYDIPYQVTAEVLWIQINLIRILASRPRPGVLYV
jgi:hypothetical protein